MRYGNDAYIFSKIWYAIKVLKSEYGYSDRDATWETRSPYLFYWKIDNQGFIKSDVKILDTNPQRVIITGNTMEIFYGPYEQKHDFEILYFDEHFIKLMDKNRKLYYFVSDSKNYKEP